MLILYDVENKILRKMNDPRIHAALNCGSISCAPLSNHPYRAESIDKDLDQASREWINSTAIRRDGNNLYLNEIFRWFREDFKADPEQKLQGLDKEHHGAVIFISKYAEEELRGKLLSGEMNLKYDSFNWGLNLLK